MWFLRGRYRYRIVFFCLEDDDIIVGRIEMFHDYGAEIDRKAALNNPELLARACVTDLALNSNTILTFGLNLVLDTGWR